MTDLTQYQERIDRKLAAGLPTESPGRLGEAIRYAVLGGGKRIRPCLVYLAAEAAGASVDAADSTACAVEMIHAYSLVHDDLPAMDDDDLRRGQPTCHIQFDEATAILAGDALQARAFEIVAQDPLLDAQQKLSIVLRLAAACGAEGMVAGQVIDLDSENRQIDVATLTEMHRKKTGALIAASVVCGGICGGADQAFLEAMDRFGYAIGLAFQIRDDILDESGVTEQLGKTAGADSRRQKSTFVSAYGLEGAATELEKVRAIAEAAIEPLGPAGEPLLDIARFIVQRDF